MSRDFNSAIHQLFPSDALLKMGYDLKDLNDANMLPKILFDKMAYDTRSAHQLASLLATLSDFNTGVQDNILIWNAGDEEESTTVLLNDYNTTAPTPIDLELQSLVKNNYVYLHDYDGSDYFEVLVHITAVHGTGGYACEIVPGTFKTSHATATNHTFAAATTQVTVVTSTTELDGRAADPTTIVPVLLDNYMERIRESGIVGTHTNSGNLNFDGSISAQMRLKMKTFLDRLNFALAIRKGYTNPATTAGNVGRFKGFQEFFHPEDRGASAEYNGAATGMAGRNAVLSSGSNIDRGELMEWLMHVVAYGNDSNEKILVVTPPMALALETSLLSGVTVNTSEFRVPGSNRIWMGTTYELTTGILHVVPDYSLMRTAMYVEDNSIHGDTATPTAANSQYWGVAFDSKYTKLVYKDVPNDPNDPGVQRPAIRDVDSYGRDSRVQQEANASLSLFIKRPETGGFVVWDK